jgi:hypothetical protein
VRRGTLDIFPDAAFYVFGLFLTHVLNGAGGDADNEAVWRKLLALGNEGAGGDDGPLAYLRAVEYGGTQCL